MVEQWTVSIERVAGTDTIAAHRGCVQRSAPIATIPASAMTNTIRLAVAALLTILVAGSFVSFGTASAQQAFTVTVAPAATSYPAGSDAVFLVRIEGNTASLPSFSYQVEGGTLAGILPATPVAANVAQGTVFVNRTTPGVATVTVSFAGQDLASGQANFVGTGAIQVRTTLNAGIDAAARTWRYEVVNASGAVVATLNVGTSGDAPTGSATTAALTQGSYTVRQVLGSDTATSCTGNAFYSVSNPNRNVQLTSASQAIDFIITPCPALPDDLQVQIPVDTIAPGNGGGVVGEAEGLVPPGETPFSEVAGAREPGFIPLPPNTGDSALAADEADVSSLFLLAAGMVAVSGGLLGWSLKKRAYEQSR